MSCTDVCAGSRHVVTTHKQNRVRLNGQFAGITPSIISERGLDIRPIQTKSACCTPLKSISCFYCESKMLDSILCVFFTESAIFCMKDYIMEGACVGCVLQIFRCPTFRLVSQKQREGSPSFNKLRCLVVLLFVPVNGNFCPTRARLPVLSCISD